MTEMTYTERAQAMTANERLALKIELTNKFTEFRLLAESSKFAAIRGVNVAREIGQQIELFTGHEKLLPAEFNDLAAAIPDAPLDFAKACLALHHRYEQPVLDYFIAAPEWEKLLVQLELLPKPGRDGAQQPHLHEPVKEFLAMIIKARNDYLTLAKEQPVAQWDAFFRESFIRESEPLARLYAEAVEIQKHSTTDGHG